MAWNDRLREAAYTSPSGERMTFAYENVSQTVEKKTTAFVFPDAPGAYIQDLGRAGRRYPLEVILTGPDCDLQADAFMAMLSETGEGRLEHPLYGPRPVVPYGTLTRRDDLKTAANQAVISVEFWETTGVIYPTAQADPAAQTLAAVEAYNDASAEAFGDALDLEEPGALAALRVDFEAMTERAAAFLEPIAATVDSVKRQFNAIERSIVQGLDSVALDPLTAAVQVALFIQNPARAVARIGSRLDAYGALLEVVAGNTAAPGFGGRGANRFRVDDLAASGAVSGSILSTVNNEFDTKGAALSAAETVLEQMAQLTEWRDDSFKALGVLDTGESYQQLQAAAAICAGYLVEISFTLKQERAIVLDRPRTIIDLTAELYGRIDPELDFFITSNNLSGAEILELPRGRRLVYYV